MQEGISKCAIDSDEQQAAVLAIADKDGFNWGYDPVHYMAPEGSYATDPDGSARVVEFRHMVQGLHALGLKVVLDVVYNHTFAAGNSCSPHAVTSSYGINLHSIVSHTIVQGYAIQNLLCYVLLSAHCFGH